MSATKLADRLREKQTITDAGLKDAYRQFVSILCADFLAQVSQFNPDKRHGSLHCYWFFDSHGAVSANSSCRSRCLSKAVGASETDATAQGKISALAHYVSSNYAQFCTELTAGFESEGIRVKLAKTPSYGCRNAAEKIVSYTLDIDVSW